MVLKLSNQVIITPGNFGIRELTYGIIGTQLNISMADGVIISILLRVVGTSVVIITGFLMGGIELLLDKKKNNPKTTKEY